MSWFLVLLSEWFNRTKVSHNYGSLAAELRSTFDIESSKPYFYLVFSDKKHSNIVEYTH